jgi:magnesium transporter
MHAHRRLSIAFLARHPAAAAVVLERLAPAHAAPLLAVAPPEHAARALACMAPLAASATLGALALETAARVLDAMPPAIAAAVLRRVPAEGAEALVGALPTSRAHMIRGLLQYRADSVGALLDPLVPGLPFDQRVTDALAWLRAHRSQADQVLFLVDRDHKLVGVLPLHALVVADEEATLDMLAQPVPSALPAAALAASALVNPAWHETRTMPVVDGNGVYLGALRYSALKHVRDADRSAATAPVDTLINLGELYWTGTSRVLAAMAAAVVDRGVSGRRR